MPLTPTDVANKQFRIAFRGYSLDEVDAFLDEVETELTRLLRDNAELRNAPAAAAETAAAAPAAAPAAPLAGMEGQEAALRTLLLAQRTADEAIAEARAEAEDIVAAARTEAEQTLTSAREEAERTLTSARTEAERTLSSSQERAARLDEEVAAKIQAATGDLDARRRALETRIDELRAFEREYRTRLKAYLEGQLRDLTSGAPADDAGSGVPAGARAAAVGGSPGSRPGVQGPAGQGAPQEDDDATPDGPPREPEGSSLRAVPPLASTAPEPVGPFTVVPAAGADSAGSDQTPSGR